MLYAYPAAAVADNWLHEALCTMIRSIHDVLDARQPVPDWPRLLPAEFRDRLESRTGLRDRLQAYVAVAETVQPQDRERILRALVEQNAVERLLSCAGDCEALGDLPEPMRAPAADLFRFAFGLLAGLGVRDAHYRSVYENCTYHMCPFCGCEYFDAPGAPRAALDHYLAFSRYPFAGVNLHNLVFMGERCNSRYKLAQDILRTDEGLRRRSYYPYGDIPEIAISLDNSVPFGGADGLLPDWNIEVNVESEEVDTWLTVFSIRERYARDVLDERFTSWLREFCWWSRSSRLTGTGDEAVLDAVERYATYLTALGLDDRAFLKSAVFRMLHKHCQDGDERLLAIVRDLAVQPQM